MTCHQNIKIFWEKKEKNEKDEENKIFYLTMFASNQQKALQVSFISIFFERFADKTNRMYAKLAILKLQKLEKNSSNNHFNTIKDGWLSCPWKAR